MNVGIVSLKPYVAILLEESCQPLASCKTYVTTQTLLKALHEGEIILAFEEHTEQLIVYTWNETIALDKPFSVGRLHALLGPWKQPYKRFSGYSFYPPLLKRPDGKVLTLSPKEGALLSCFLENPSLSRSALLQQVWGYNEGIDTHTLETHIYSLRQKLGETEGPSALLVTTSDGYAFHAV